VTTHLSHSTNKHAFDVVQCQRITSMWANDLARGTITRDKVTRLISEYPDEQQPTFKHWLNTYREAVRKRAQANAVKPRHVPRWVKR